MSCLDSHIQTVITASPKRVLVTKLGHIGDVLVTTPFFKVLKKIFPGVRTTALVNQGTEEMAQGCPYIDEVLIVERDKKTLRQRMGSSLRLICALKTHPFDMSFELSAGDRGSYMCRIAGARLRVGFASPNGHVRDKFFHALATREEAGCHEVENFLRQLCIFKRPFTTPALQWQPNSEALAHAQRIIDENHLKKFVLMHPTSRWMFKTWTPEKNAFVIRHLNSQGWRVLLSAGPEGKEMAFIEKILAYLSPGPMLVNVAGKLNLTLLGALLQKASLFFGVDSAPMHLAAAVQTPVLALFGPSGEHMWGPWQVRHRVLSGECAIRPCGKDGCNGSKICRSLVEMPAQTVCAAIDEMLAEV